MEATGICAHMHTDQHPTPNQYLLHTHDSYEIFLLLSGSCGFQVAERLYRPEADTVLLLRRNEAHRLLPDNANPISYLFLQFTEEILPDEPEVREQIRTLFENREEGMRSLRQLSPGSAGFLRECMHRMCALTAGDVHTAFLCYLRPVLWEILSRGTPSSGTPRDIRREPSHSMELVEQVCAYINRNFAQIENLSAITDTFHYSTVYINSLFQKRFGVSVWQYLLHRRVDCACDLMLSGLRAEEAALRCGFADYSTFYRVFRKSYGITPSECIRSGVKPRLRDCKKT